MEKIYAMCIYPLWSTADDNFCDSVSTTLLGLQLFFLYSLNKHDFQYAFHNTRQPGAGLVYVSSGQKLNLKISECKTDIYKFT